MEDDVIVYKPDMLRVLQETVIMVPFDHTEKTGIMVPFDHTEKTV